MSDYELVKSRASLNDYAAQFLQKSGGLWCCPACGSGTHGTRDSDGALGIYDNGKKWKCHSCGAGGDVFDLAGILNNTGDKAEQLQIVAQWAGGTLDSSTATGGSFRERKADWASVPAADGSAGTDGAAQDGNAAQDEPRAAVVFDYSEGRANHRRYIAECAARLRAGYESAEGASGAFLEAASFLKARGIETSEAVALGIGYDPNYKGKGQTRVVIPWAGNDYYHADRALVDVPGKYSKPPSEPDESRGIKPEMCVGEQPLYNPQAFGQDYIIAVEGELDAISIGLCGYNAIGIGGTQRVKHFVNEAMARNYSGVVIDMLDADGDANGKAGERKGRGAGADLVTLLAEAGITTLARAEYGIDETDDYNGHKDAGEYFADNRQDFVRVRGKRLAAPKKRTTAKLCAPLTLRILRGLPVTCWTCAGYTSLSLPA